MVFGDGTDEVEETAVYEEGAGKAPAADEGKLVAWSPYRGWGMHAGWLAWIGDERIGRVDVDEDGICQWYVSLPSEERPIDGMTLEIDGAKTVVELWARRWCCNAGLVPARYAVDDRWSGGEVLASVYGTDGDLSLE